jgi:hypothetical protein
MSGSYVDGPPGTPHYVMNLTAQAGGALNGTLLFLFQDGRTSESFSFTGTARDGVAQLATSGGPHQIAAIYSPGVVVLTGCVGYLQDAQSDTACRFTYSSSATS